MATLQRKLPFGPEKLVPFTEELFDREERKAARILWSILETQSPRKSDWSQVFSDSSEGANYRTVERLLPKLDAKKALMRLYDPESPFVIVDPTEVERKQAKKSAYVGRLSDGKTSRVLDDRLRSALQRQSDPFCTSESTRRLR